MAIMLLARDVTSREETSVRRRGEKEVGRFYCFQILGMSSRVGVERGESTLDEWWEEWTNIGGIY